ncbi:hypothetical protein [Actinomadura geliboluensis]|uniref:Aspartate/glutamate racemase family protein n=1 Tax=Actinomadura geliboluensis TaxID=882440 RepID=A0A5S4G9U8_9ACTN|nr:hypothetical protein [Actinomadura geliboluensis]TMR29642.1 hypothetical protein ETD96_35200 [Actinomadura geliboluensis]
MTTICANPAQHVTDAPQNQATMGIISLGHIDPVQGTAAHHESFPWPTRWRALTDENLIARALTADPALYPEVLKSARDLIGQGAQSILTTCGYFTPYQAGLAKALPVPVLTSSLLQLPGILATTGEKKVLVLAANAAAIDARCLAGSGLGKEEQSRLVIRGLEGPGPFREQVLEGGGLHDVPSIIQQASQLVSCTVADHDAIGAILLECGDLCLAAQPLRSATGLPVFDYITAALWLQSSVPARTDPRH